VSHSLTTSSGAFDGFGKIHCVRVWDPRSARISQRFFLRKHEVLFGSDKAVDIKLKVATGFYARLDFQTQEIHFIEADRVVPAEPGNLIGVGDYVVQWKILNIFDRRFRWAVLGLLLSTIFLSFFAFFHSSSHVDECSDLDRKIAIGDWNSKDVMDQKNQEFLNGIFELKKSFQTALHQNAFVKARAELQSLELTLAQRKVWNRPRSASLKDIQSGEDQSNFVCDIRKPLQILEWKLTERLASSYFKQKNFLAAAKELKTFHSRFGISPDNSISIERRILRQAEKIYYEGYRLEDDEPERGEEMMENAQEICRELGKDRNCFRSASNDLVLPNSKTFDEAVRERNGDSLKENNEAAE